MYNEKFTGKSATNVGIQVENSVMEDGLYRMTNHKKNAERCTNLSASGTFVTSFASESAHEKNIN